MANTAVQTEIIDKAISFLGIPYVYGGKNPATGLDCSGLTSAAYLLGADITIDAGTVGQLPEGTAVIPTGSNVAWADVEPLLQPCDLIFPTDEHVQLYIGSGIIIEAPETGQVVVERAEWSPTIYAVRRILPPDLVDISTATSARLDPGASLTPGMALKTGPYEFVMQTDGNLVAYKNTIVGMIAVFNTATEGNPGAYAVMQTDGNLVVYLGSKALWQSGTSGKGASTLMMRDTGTLDITNGTVTWSVTL